MHRYMKRIAIGTAILAIVLIISSNVNYMKAKIVNEVPGSPGIYKGIDEQGYVALYENVDVGDTVTSILLFNPLSPAPDALLWRIDFLDSGIEII